MFTITEATWKEFFQTVGTIAAGYFAFRAAGFGKKQLKQSEENKAGIDDLTMKTSRQYAPQILIVEDNENDVELMRYVLKAFNVEVFVANSANSTRDLLTQRVARARGFPFDLVLVDLKLNGGFGDQVVEVCDELARGVPIAVITGFPDPVILSRLGKDRPITVLMKPLTDESAEKLLYQFSIPFHRTRREPN